MQKLNDTICFLITAAVFAMIGIEYSATSQPTHSGTQPLSRQAALLPHPYATKP